MKIELHKLTISPDDFDLGDHIKQISSDPLDQRNRQSDRSKNYIRMEHTEKVGNLWFCDFVKVRVDHGPAKAGRNNPVIGFPLQKDEGFGEETGFLWDPIKGYCIIQYNHHGVRPQAMIQYLSLYDHENPVILSLLPKLDDEVHAKIRRAKMVNKFQISVAPKHLTNADYKQGQSVLGGIKDLSTTDADVVSIEISVRSSRKQHKTLAIPLAKLDDWLEQFRSAFSGQTTRKKNAAVKSASATIKESDSSPAEVLDLLHHRVIDEANLTPGPDKRYSQKDRWASLAKAHLRWKPLMK